MHHISATVECNARAFGGDTDLVDCSRSPSYANSGGPSGIIGTTTIDLSSNTLYVVGNINVGVTVSHYLFGINISNGGDTVPKQIIASRGNVSVAFSAQAQLQRAGLLLADYSVLVPYASYGDHTPYQGWMFSFNRGDLGPLDNWNYAGPESGAGIWMSAGGAAFDGTSVYFSTGNNFGDGTTSSILLSNSVLQVNPYGGPPGHQSAGLAQINQFLPLQATLPDWTLPRTSPGEAR